MLTRITVISILCLAALIPALAADDDKELSEMFYKAGIKAAKDNDFAEAARKFERALEYQPDFPEAMFKLAECCEKTGQKTRAVENYRLCRKSLSGQRHQLSKEEQDLLSRANRALDRVDTAGKELRQARAAQCAELMKLANDCYNRRYLRMSLRVVELILRLDPDFAPAKELLAKLKQAGITSQSKPKPNKEQAYKFMAEAINAAGQRDYQQALELFDQAIKVDPSNYEAYTNRGVCYAALGQIDQAIKDLNEAIKLNPKNVGAYANRASLYYSKKDYVRAIEDTSAALRLNPRDTGAGITRAASYYNTNEFDKAINDYNNVLQSKPDTTSAYQGLACCHYQKGNLKEAAQNAQRYLDYKPDGESSGQMRTMISECNKKSGK
ncbi:MAG: tetratricopeptide repeat protein [Candidatus Brocadiia bacterium]